MNTFITITNNQLQVGYAGYAFGKIMFKCFLRVINASLASVYISSVNPVVKLIFLLQCMLTYLTIYTLPVVDLEVF